MYGSFGRGVLFFLLSLMIHCLLAYIISFLPQGNGFSFREGGAGFYHVKVLENGAKFRPTGHGIQAVARRDVQKSDFTKTAPQQRLVNVQEPRPADLRGSSDACAEFEHWKGSEDSGGGRLKGDASGGGFLPPVPILRKKPAYPAVAIRRGYAGRVLLRLFVSVAGDVSDVRLLRSSGYRVLDGAAIRAVKSWRFSPAMRGGRPVGLWVEVPIVFELRDRVGCIPGIQDLFLFPS